MSGSPELSKPQSITLDERLSAAAGFCRNGKIAVDVGCDHAQLACFLAKNISKSVIASDVRDGPLCSARKTVEKQGVSNVRVVKSDGLCEIDFADDVIICGMGGELIAQIIEGCRFLNGDTRFILQPMTKADYLRRFLCSQGFEIIEEKGAEDGGHVYTVMLVKFTGKRFCIDEIFALVGKNTDPRYLKMTAHKLLKNAAGMEKSADLTDKAVKLRELAEKILTKAEEI